MTTSTSSSSLKLLMEQKRQQLKAQLPLASPFSPPISVITPEQRRLLQPPQSSTLPDDGAKSKGRPVLRKKRPMVFELVTQSPTRQSPPRRPSAPPTPPTCHPSDETHQPPQTTSRGIHFELVMEKSAKESAKAASATAGVSSIKASTSRLSAQHMSTSLDAMAKSRRGNKENQRGAVEEKGKSTASTAKIAKALPSISTAPPPTAKTRPSSHGISSSSSLPFLSLRQQLSSLPLPLLEAEVLRIHSLSLRPFPILPSLYFASVPLSLLLQWLQTVVLAQSISHSSPRYLVHNFTSSLSDGIVLLLLLHYYHPDALHYSNIQWHDGIKVVDNEGVKSLPVEAEVITEDEGSNGEREKGWVGAFSFAELTRVQQSEAEKAAIVNWGVIRLALESVAPQLHCSEGMGSGKGRVEEARMVIFLCQLSALLLSRSAEVHAARRLQRWWRRNIQRRSITRHLHSVITDARQGAMQEEMSPIPRCGLESSSVVEEEDVMVDESLDLPPPTPSRALRHSLMLLDWNDPTTLQQARMRAEEAQRTVTVVTAAALQIQSRWRGRIGRREAMAVRSARDVEKRVGESRRCEEMEAAAIAVQRVYRGWRVRRNVRILIQLKKEVEAQLAVGRERQLRWDEQRRSAVVSLQTAVRGWLARRLLTRLREVEQAKRKSEFQRKERERSAARLRAVVVLQAHIRGHLARVQLRQRLALQEKQRREDEEATIALNRRLQAEKEARLLREKERQRAQVQEEEKARRVHVEAERTRRDDAALTIQRAWRNWQKTTRMVEELREGIYAARLEGAVVAMQAIVRGKQARREVALLRADRSARLNAEKEERVREEKRREERQRLLHRVQTINATAIQTQLRVYLARRLLSSKQAEYVQHAAAEQQRSAAVIQAAWRGYQQRKQTPHLITVRRTLVKLRHHRTASQTMEGRTQSALTSLHTSHSLASITRAVHTLSVTSTLACICESLLLPALPALFSLIRSCNRSTPHQQLLLLCLTTLTNIASHPSTHDAVYHHPNSADVLVEQLQVYRDHTRIMRRIVHLLERGTAVNEWMTALTNTGEEDGMVVVKRVEAVCELLERKTRSERRLGRAWWGGEEKVRAIREMDDIARRLRAFITPLLQ